MMKRDVINVISDKCMKCFKCIEVCPIKTCISAVGDSVEIDHDKCLACGACIAVCDHDARDIKDDLEEFLLVTGEKKKFIAIVAPSVVAVFGDDYLRFNGLLKSMGADAVFDVSFGAELSTMSYIDYIKTEKPKTVITQPCPALVNYIENYKPSLLKYLAPVHSPMLCTIEYIKSHYPEYQDHKLVVLSPCIAKRLEFNDTYPEILNVTFLRMKEYLKSNDLEINKHNKVEFDGDPAERAVLFSSPGGLKRTVERTFPELSHKIRKVEGRETVYDYLDNLEISAEDDVAPLIVDCLNCEKGCNGGSGTGNIHKPIDEIEADIEIRCEDVLTSRRKIDKLVKSKWTDLNLKRTYKNKFIEIPALEQEQEKKILESLGKFTDKDLYNCSSCGYHDCKVMAQAIHAGLNTKDNCYHFQISEMEKARKTIDSYNLGLEKKIAARTASLKNILDNTGQGFFIFGANYLIESQFSKGCIDILGRDIKNMTVTDILFPGKPDIANDFRQGFDLYFSGKSNIEIIINLTEKVTILNNKIISIEYKAISKSNILCILTDITLEKEIEDKNKIEVDRQKKILQALSHKHFFSEYIAEAEHVFSHLEFFSYTDPSENELKSLMRDLHTFKANSAFFGYNLTQEVAHESETIITDNQYFENAYSIKEIAINLKTAFYKEMKVVTDIMGESWIEEASAINVPKASYSKIVNYVRTKFPVEKKLIHYLESYRMVPFRDLFSRLPFIATSTAEKLGKKIQPMTITGGEMRVIPDRYYGLSESLLHLVNNIVDHGIELSYEREAVQKRPMGKIELYIAFSKSQILMEFKDDGRGINPKEIEFYAKKNGLIDSEQKLTNFQLINLIFDEGFSTRTEASTTSGRGIGLSVVKSEIEKLGGTIEVQSRLGKGSTFEIMIPSGNKITKRS